MRSGLSGLSALALWMMLPLRGVHFIEGEGGGGAPPIVPPVENPDDVKFTPAQQKKVDALVTFTRKDAQQKELDKVKSALAEKDLTEKEKKRLEERQSELETALEGEKATAKKDREKLSADHAKALKTEADQKQYWKDKFQKTQFRLEVRQAAEEFDAKDADQISDLVEPKVKLIEEKDEKLNPTGDYALGIEVDVEGENKKKTKQTVSVSDYVKLMSENPKNDNLFRSGRIPGSGTTRPAGGKGGQKKKSSTEKISAGLGDLVTRS